ncbi:hypothetical protein A4X13_0g705 [Tilletia indica]|uniref:Choline kinase N-terminal domain-containing protein n=1 Tax=Tilletia indica TaxID=43049 RepID=A0A177TS22_9BASI|nr:hypothetical protein A4X13_0g705 [Tilletia indica]
MDRASQPRGPPPTSNSGSRQQSLDTNAPQAAGYTFGFGNAHYTAPSPALSASASSYEGSVFGGSEVDTDLHALSLDDLDPDGPAFGSPLQRPHRASLRRDSSRSSTNSSVDETVDARDEEEAHGEAEAAAFDAEDEDEADMHAEGVPAAWGFKLDARTWEAAAYKEAVLDLLSQRLELPGWKLKDVNPALAPLKPECVHLKRISGAMSNAVFFVSYRPKTAKIAAKSAPAASEQAQAPPLPSDVPTPPPTVLLRVYGTGTEVLLSRRAELLILHTLSSLYSIGPHILGTFANGRVEEYFDCVPIGKDGLRALGDRGADSATSVHGKEGTAQWVARRMRELHEVPLDVMKTVLERGDLQAPGPKGFGRGIENHIMASSHRPRRHKTNASAHRPSMTPALDKTPPGAAQASQGIPHNSTSAPVDTSIAAIAADGARQQAIESHKEGDLGSDYLNIPRPSLATTGAGDSYGYVQSRNNSVASFDSLATSYNSHTSSWSGSEAAVNSLYPSGPTSPWPFTATPDGTSETAGQTSFGSSVDGASTQQAQFMGFTSPKSPFMVAQNSIPPTPLEKRGSISGFDAMQQHQKSPYPGVWRRMKRWSREAGKVIGLVDAFCSTPEGRAAAERALGHPLHELGVRASTWHSSDLGPTKGNLGNALRTIAALDLASFVLQLDWYKDFVRRVERREGQSKRVFAHNDSQYGNLLIKKSAETSTGVTSQPSGTKARNGRNGSVDGGEGSGREVARGMPRERSGSIIAPGVGSMTAITPAGAKSRSSSRSRREAPHEALVVIDFEYAAPNPRGFDIANHFQEWSADYHHPTLAWSLTHHAPYPNESERRRWLRAYVEQGRFLRLRVGSSKLPVPEAASSARSPATFAKSPKPIRTNSDIDELEALPPPAMSVPTSLNTVQEVQRAALEQSSGIRPELSRNTSITPPTRMTQSPSTPSSKNMATPLLSRQASASQSPTDVATRGGAGRTIKVANSPALHALYSPSLSPHVGPFAVGAERVGTPGGGLGSSSQNAANEASVALAKLEASIEKEVDRIEREIWLWGPACHAVWGLWGIVFAKEEIEQLLANALDPNAEEAAPKSEPEVQEEGEGGDAGNFDYLRYALGRIELFRDETVSMNIQPNST